MAGLISTGIWGFICSATMKAGKITATFISGATGWIIKNNGDAEFKSIYARDKIVTNEYVYNRIRVTEDEEVVTSNGKILASFLNDDGSYNVQLDLREGDRNPFAANDLLQGYYHSPGNTGVIYAVQKMIVMEILDDQTMNVTCLSESSPYKYMVIVRVGNTQDTDRQSFIRISSRTNCQYFYDEIASFIDLDNPDKVKCAIGKADVGLIPSWAAKVTGSVRRWFGLVADGVILRGTFILKNNKTIEDELNGKITELSGKFEIRESGITGKWEETIKAADNAVKAEESVTKMVGEFQVTAEHLTADFSKTVTTATTKATEEVTKAGEDATSLVNRTAEESATKMVGEFQVTAEHLTADFSKTVTTATTNATGEVTKAGEDATSLVNRTAEESVTKMVGEFQVTAENLTADFSKTVTTATTNATGVIDTAKDAATSSLALSAEQLTLDFSKTVQTATTNATGEVTRAGEVATSSLNRTAEGLKDSFEKSFTDANGEITQQIKTQVTQNAKQWKVEVMGSDAQGNPNTVLAAINADKSGVKITGDKIQITGELLATVIKTYGLNVNDLFTIDEMGRVIAYGDFHTGKTGPRVSITRTQDGPVIRMYTNNSAPVIDIRALIDDTGNSDIRIKMLDTKNINKWAEYGVGKCHLVERLEDATQYETVIEAGRIRLYKNGIEVWNTNKR